MGDRWTEGKPNNASGYCPMTITLNRLAVCRLNRDDLDQCENQEIAERDRIGGQVARVSPTPTKPSKRTIPPITPATIITFF